MPVIPQYYDVSSSRFFWALFSEDPETKIAVNDTVNKFLNDYVQTFSLIWGTFLIAVFIKCIWLDVRVLSPEEEEKRRKEHEMLLYAEMEVERRMREDKKKEINALYESYGADQPFPDEEDDAEGGKKGGKRGKKGKKGSKSGLKRRGGNRVDPVGETDQYGNPMPGVAQDDQNDVGDSDEEGSEDESQSVLDSEVPESNFGEDGSPKKESTRLDMHDLDELAGMTKDQQRELLVEHFAQNGLGEKALEEFLNESDDESDEEDDEDINVNPDDVPRAQIEEIDDDDEDAGEEDTAGASEGMKQRGTNNIDVTEN